MPLILHLVENIVHNLVLYYNADIDKNEDA